MEKKERQKKWHPNVLMGCQLVGSIRAVCIADPNHHPHSYHVIPTEKTCL